MANTLGRGMALIFRWTSLRLQEEEYCMYTGEIWDLYGRSGNPSLSKAEDLGGRGGVGVRSRAPLSFDDER